MKSFLKYLLAAITGSFIALLLVFIVIKATVKAGFRALEAEEVAVEDNSVLVIDLASGITDRPNAGMSFGFGGEFARGAGLADVLNAIDHAATDDRVEGILIKMSFMAPGLATMAEVREQLADFKESGKFVMAYGNYTGQRSYYLSSVAEEIYLNPAGLFELRGFSAQVTFYKEALEKLGIDLQVFYAGKYKSATEPFRLDRMSAENREQVRSYMTSVYEDFFGTIAQARGKSFREVDSLAHHLVVRSPQDALRHGLVDGVIYYDEVLSKLRQKMSLEDESDEPRMVNLGRYIDDIENDKGDKDQIVAVVYAEGAIAEGSETDGTVGGEAYARELRKLREDEDVKAIVLRINSPGGGAMASEVIWREVRQAGAAKPVIVSMGNVAASGGYFIAAPAHVIMAQPNTITGSIGVFLVWPNLQELSEDKLGITHDTVNIGRFADFGNPFRQITEEERAIFQSEVDRTYEEFVQKVAEGRGMDTAGVHKLAQGRVWSGTQALANGLVDTLGGLREAIELAARRAGVEKYVIQSFPEAKSPFDRLRELLGAQSLLPEWVNADWLSMIEAVNTLSTERGMMARMLWEVEL